LWGIYRGEEVNQIITFFLGDFGETSRTKPALKKKIGELHVKLLAKLTEATPEALEQEKMG
jgi:hypothetical protein